MATQYSSANVMCPFYKGEDRHNVRCEGLDGCESLGIGYRTMGDKQNWQEAHCDTDYESCPIFRLIMKEKYA